MDSCTGLKFFCPHCPDYCWKKNGISVVEVSAAVKACHGSSRRGSAPPHRSSMRSNPPPKNRQQQRPEPSSLQGVPPEGQSPEAQLKARLPKTGYFALADPKAEYNTAQQERNSQPAPGAAAPRSPTSSSTSSSALPTTFSPTVSSASAFPSSPTPAPVFTSQSAAGAISLNRLAELDNLAADPTPLLQSIKEKEAREREEQEQFRRQLVEETQRRRAEARSVPLPRGDLRRLDRSNRVARQMATTVVSTKPEDYEYKAQVLAQEAARYEAEKTGQRLWTAVFSLVGTAASYATYGREVSISYVVGALAGIVWNTTFADDYGVHLNFLAILVGFLTYKVALLSKQAKELADEMSVKPRQEQE
ncbi:hypothetical protein DUNSADRAFT_3082 [Dunaliella salina]|uniref:Uncharacterized protein n=1 Tax=Dunaliella salina TaxID=3046 RepID=A0ABQ7GUI9_DUNSA|nr:hypothetical protein DUNSADRAFT_3082 [Dunaliella salina]|eukprot:KAF5838286.1 hypothetical protein DUNSADRAFT_3082 [Dunaliella salina]